MQKKLIHVSMFIFVSFFVVCVVYATSKLTPPGSVTNTMYSLTDIYNLGVGTTAPLGTGAIETTPGTIAETGKTLTEVYTKISGEVAKLSSGVLASGTTAFGISGSMSAGGLLKTNQTLCYDVAGTAITCTDGGIALGGQDGYYQKGITLSYTDNLDGTISDGATGLMWKKCSEGKSYDTDTHACTGSDATKTWTQALAACEADTTAEHNDWRLPNIRELLSIVDYRVVSPAINSLFISQSFVYWSSSTYQSPGYQNYSWNVNFNDGVTSVDNKANSYYVRCVR